MYNATVFTIANHKGGVGKTTTAVNLGASFAEANRKTLVIDLDSQASATNTLLGRGEASRLDEVLLGNAAIQDVVRATGRRDLWVVAGSGRLVGVEHAVGTRGNGEGVLRRAVEAARGHYEYIIIDAPPALGPLSVNALLAADVVVIPVQCEYMAMEGIARLEDTLARMATQREGKEVKRLYVMTMYDSRNRLAGEVVQEVKKHFGEMVSTTVIPRSVRLAEAPGYQRTGLEHDPQGKGVQAYRDLAKEMMSFEA
tara:strand:+ start:2196 stop:2960 length:765 start_codon:yes stop_codon:yes gene_type:complete